MPTAHPNIFAALCHPFPSNEVKTRSQGGRQLSYITGRSAQNRFDSVLGPENWRDTYTDTPEGLRCRIEIRLTPDGEWLWKEDGGAGADMPEADNEEKSAYSDAFKRAAVKWGVARYLYQDGVPKYETNRPAGADTVRTPAPQSSPSPARQAPSSNGNPAAFEPDGSIKKPGSGKGMFASCKEQQDKHQAEFIKPLNEWAKQNGMANRMVDWSEDEIEKGWRHLCYLVAKHTGTLGTGPAPAANGNGHADVTAIKKSITGKAGELLNKKNGTPPTDSEIGTHVKGLFAELFPGFDIRNGDAGQWRKLAETIDMEFKELPDDSIPF